MRRAFTLAALVAFAVPALAVAQAAAPGEVIPATAGTGNDDQFINIEECAGVGPDGPVTLNWTIQPVDPLIPIVSGEYKIYASNKEPAASAPRWCVDDNPTQGNYKKQVATGTTFNTTAGQTTANGDVPTADFVRALAGAPGYTCTEGSADQTIHVCIEYVPSTGTGANTRQGWAVGTLIVSLRRPNAPASVTATPGDDALNLSWPAATTGAVNATQYRVVVKQGATVVSTREQTGTSIRISGLTNGTEYNVEVFGMSDARNVSSTAATTTGKPQPVDGFWEYYSDGNACDDPATAATTETCPGREQGGCGAGAAGPLSLLAVAGLLAVLRRRK